MGSKQQIEGVSAVTEPGSEGPSYQSNDRLTQAPISTKPLVSKQTRKSTAIISAVVTLVVLAALVGLGYLMYKSYDWAAAGATPATVRLRDIAFIVMGLETLIAMILVLIIVVLLVVLIVLIYDRVIPILEQLNRAINSAADAVQTARGTTSFISDKIATPLIELSSYAAGVARIAREIADLWPWKRRDAAPGSTAVGKHDNGDTPKTEPPAVTD
jgi:type II secretory pathway pseudopilin PulG